VLVVTSAGNPFSSYVGEILRAEGVNAFTTIDVSLLSASLVNGFDVVLLGETPLTAAQVTTLTNWVTAGGNLIAMRPDKQLAGLLGLTDAAATLANSYLKVDTSVSPGAGIVANTIQFHGTADKYTLSGATAVASLYSDASTATANPAVTLRSVGTSGGQAAAFTFDLARSVVLTRQGNPAWAGQERDGAAGIRPSDMFFGAKTGDIQPDWVDTNKIAIPQADEQQRLLVNLITATERDKLPLPHFWYLPRGKKAAIVMSGDDHSPGYAPGGTASNFDRFKALSPIGCVVANWEWLHRRRLRHRAPSERGLVSHRRPHPVRALGDVRHAARAVPGEVHKRPVTGRKPHTLRLLARLGVRGKSRVRSRCPAGRELLPLPQHLDRQHAGLHERRRLPDALHRPRRNRDRRLPAEHEHDGRVGTGLSRNGRRDARQRARPTGLLRRLRHERPHRQSGAARRRRGDRRLRAGPRRADHLV
jgi:hypothetical protein